MIKLVISGGQTGADQGGLLAAKMLGIPTGGTAPKGYRTLRGCTVALGTLFGLKEHYSSHYQPRTYTNVYESDGTIRLAGSFVTAGELCTKKAIIKHNKPHFDVLRSSPPSIRDAAAWIEKHNIETLNVAGNSEDTSPGIEDFTVRYISSLLQFVNNLEPVNNEADMFLTMEEHYKYFEQQILAKPKAVIISTFGVFAGILDDGRDTQEWGPKYEKVTRKIVDLLEGVPDVKILVGLYRYQSCKGNIQCDDCAAKYIKGVGRLIKHREKWPNFKWRFSSECHLKSYLFFYPDGRVTGIAGGRNLTDSEWADVTFPLTKDQVKRLIIHVNGIWNKSAIMDEDKLAEELTKQVNSIKYPQSMEKLLNS